MFVSSHVMLVAPMTAKTRLCLFIVCVIGSVLNIARTVNADIVVEAFAGEPFGVAHITLSLDPTVDRSLVNSNGYQIDDLKGRVLYPTFSSRRVLGLLRDLVGTRNPGGTSAITAWFLFRGTEPFTVTIRTPEEHRIRVIPRHRPLRHIRMLNRWWRQYTSAAKSQLRTGDYPPVVETYLTSMLESRLRLDRDRAESVTDKRSSLENDLLRLLFNTESIRIDAMRDKMLSAGPESQSRYPVPPGIAWPQDARNVELPDGAIETMAHYVPSDWFYLRFGSFDNYLWLTELAEQNGGDLSQMLSLRGHDPLISTKMQLQLGLRENALSKILGGQVISDLAVVGRDMYMREGAAIGVLFEARNALLAKDLMKQRQAALEALKEPSAKIETLQISGQNVSFASSPDNRLRSFYVSKDNFHLVTNCRAMVESFLAEDRKLAEASDFRRIRSDHPADADQTAFVYLSKDFLRNLLSPQYQVELRRRLNSVTEMELLQLAQLAAKAEGHADLPSNELIRLGFLPRSFGIRSDGSQLAYANGGLYDSVRGARGFFLPIPDMAISNVSRRELQVLAEIEEFQQSRWTDMDAISVFVRRESADKNLERVSFDAKLDSFSPVKYGRWASIIGPANAKRIVQPEGNIITAQASLQGGQMLPNTGAHLIFLGIRDEEADISLSRGRVQQTLQILRTAPAYFGSWPKAGLLDLLPVGNVVLDNDNAFERLPLGLWRWTDQDFSAIGFHRDALAKSVSDLDVENREELAQLHVHIGDVVHSKLGNWFRTLNYQRALETSVGNTRLLATVSQQLRVAPAESRLLAERILDIQLVCPLDGEYKLTESHGGEYWKSTAWTEDHKVPDEFSTPMAKWFRGLDVQGTVGGEKLELDAVLVLERQESSGPRLPVFDFFNRKK